VRTGSSHVSKAATGSSREKVARMFAAFQQQARQAITLLGAQVKLSSDEQTALTALARVLPYRAPREL
jgi:hypothetical protein